MILFLLLAPVLGAIIGSTVNALVPRLASGEGGYLTDRSRCPHCRTVLRVRHLVPVFSYLVLRGRCASCRTQIPLQYLFVELAGATAFTLVVLDALQAATFQPWTLLLTLLLVASLLAISAYDALTMEIPFVLVLPALAIALVRAALPGGGTFTNALLGAGVVGGFFLLQILILTPLYRMRARRAKETPPSGVLGGGDALLGLVLGLAVGWPAAVPTVFGAYVLGALVTLPLLLRGSKGGKSPIPFGPFLAAATVFGILWGDALVHSYLGLLAS